MSTYLLMWEGVRALNAGEVDEMIERISPAQGLGYSFNGITVCDVDLLEALHNWKKDL